MTVFNSQLAGCSVWTVGCHTPGWPPPDPGRRTQARGLSVGRAGAAQPGWSFRGPLPGGGPHRHPPHPASSPPGGDGGPPGPGSPGAASGGASASCRPPPAAPEPHPALALGAPTLLEGLGDESHSGSAPGLGPWDPQLSTTATSSAGTATSSVAAWPAGSSPVSRRGRQGPHQARRQLAFHSGVAVRSVPPAPAPVAAASPSLGSRGLLSSHGPGSSIRGLRLCRRPRSGPRQLLARATSWHTVTLLSTWRPRAARGGANLHRRLARILPARASVCLENSDRSGSSVVYVSGSWARLCHLRVNERENGSRV